MQKLKIIFSFLVFNFSAISFASNSTKNTSSDQVIQVNNKIWMEFNKEERLNIMNRFPNLEIIPSEAIGVVHSAQLVDRSTSPTNTGAIVGSAIGQAAYIDKAFSGSGSNYSAVTHLGIGILGALIGSTLDSPGKRMFVINYAINTLDGQMREVRIASSEEFLRPIGQCVKFPEIEPVSSELCSLDKIRFLKRVAAEAVAPNDALVIREPTGINVKCRLTGIGMMMLEKNTCLQMEGFIEK